MEERIRQLERMVATGDTAAQASLLRERVRSGWLADVSDDALGLLFEAVASEKFNRSQKSERSWILREVRHRAEPVTVPIVAGEMRDELSLPTRHHCIAMWVGV